MADSERALVALLQVDATVDEHKLVLTLETVQMGTLTEHAHKCALSVHADPMYRGLIGHREHV
jgi:hypothetical protein